MKLKKFVRWKNVAIVTNKTSTGYQSPDITINEDNLTGSGMVEPEILAQASKPSNQYRVNLKL